MGKAGNKLMPRVLKVQRKNNNNNNNNLSPPQTLPSTSQEQQQPQQSAAPIQQKTTPRGGAVKGTATKREREIHLIDDEETEVGSWVLDEFWGIISRFVTAQIISKNKILQFKPLTIKKTDFFN